MASAGVFCATILLLAAAVSASISGASHPLTAAEATDHAITEEEMEEAMAARGHRGSATQKMTASLASAEEEGRKTGSYWGKARKLDDDDDHDDSDHGSDSDHDHDSDSDNDRDHDSDSDHGHDHDSDSDDNDDDDHNDRDHDSDSDHDHDHDSDSDHDHDHDSDSDDNDDDDHNSENERKKHAAAQGRKGAPGGKHDDKAA